MFVCKYATKHLAIHRAICYHLDVRTIQNIDNRTTRWNCYQSFAMCERDRRTTRIVRICQQWQGGHSGKESCSGQCEGLHMEPQTAGADNWWRQVSTRSSWEWWRDPNALCVDGIAGRVNWSAASQERHAGTIWQAGAIRAVSRGHVEPINIRNRRNKRHDRIILLWRFVLGYGRSAQWQTPLHRVTLQL